MSTTSSAKCRPRNSATSESDQGANRASRNLELVVFPSELGWMAAIIRRTAKQGDLLCELTFGHDSPQSAVAKLAIAGDAAPTKRQPALVTLLQAYARGERVDLNKIHLDTHDLPPFALQVVRQCRRIAYGQTLTYGEVAARAGSPRAARAVGNVMRTNTTPLVVPCHRVVAQGNSLGSYSAAGGVRAKLRLLELEGNR